MDVIGHAENGKHFMTALLNDACDVLVDLFAVLFLDQRLSAFYGEYKLGIELGVSVRHDKRPAPTGRVIWLKIWFFVLETADPYGACALP